MTLTMGAGRGFNKATCSRLYFLVNLEASMEPSEHEKLPGLFCNRFGIGIAGDLARIVFSEIPLAASGTEYPRAAIVMSLSDLVELGAIIDKLKDQHAEALANARKRAN
jgi:hypothetical protein